MSAAAERGARALLVRVAEPGDAQLGAQVAVAGAQEVVARLRSGRLPHPSSETMRARLAALPADDDLREAAHAGARLVCPGDREWPPALASLAEREPLALWVRGPLDLAEATRHSVAVVGARAATAYGSRVAGEIAAGLAERGYTVVSGAAYGIDAAAHRGALAVGGRTVAVLACGVDVAYPRGHGTLLARVAAEHLVVSELAPGVAPTRRWFLERNRIIAALACGTVVVEAALRSGARSTAARAAELSRPVMAVPGPVTSMASAGCHLLVREGAAVLVTDAAEVAELLAPVGEHLAAPETTPARLHDGLPPDLARVLEALPARGAHDVDRVAHDAAALPGITLGALAVLESRGLAERSGAGWRVTRRGRGRG